MSHLGNQIAHQVELNLWGLPFFLGDQLARKWSKRPLNTVPLSSMISYNGSTAITAVKEDSGRSWDKTSVTTPSRRSNSLMNGAPTKLTLTRLSLCHILASRLSAQIRQNFNVADHRALKALAPLAWPLMVGIVYFLPSRLSSRREPFQSRSLAWK